jgi:hypothetical protein
MENKKNMIVTDSAQAIDTIKDKLMDLVDREGIKYDVGTITLHKRKDITMDPKDLKEEPIISIEKKPRYNLWDNVQLSKRERAGRSYKELQQMRKEKWERSKENV